MTDEIKKPETPKVSGTEKTNTKVTPTKTGNSLPPVAKQKPQPKPDPVREKIMAAGFAPKVNKEAGAKLNGKKIKPGSPNKDENTPVGVVKKPLESNKGVNKRVDKMFKETEQPTLGVWNHDKKDKLMAPADEIKFNPKYDKSEKANQVLEDRKKIMAAGFKPNSKSSDLSDLDIDAQRWLGRGDIYDFEVERPSNDNFTYIKRKNLMDDSEEKFNYDRNTGKLTYLDGSGYTDIDYKGNPDAEYHSSEQIRKNLDNLNTEKTPDEIINEERDRQEADKNKADSDINTAFERLNRAGQLDVSGNIITKENVQKIMNELGGQYDEDDIIEVLENHTAFKKQDDYDDNASTPERSNKPSIDPRMGFDYDDDRVEIYGRYPRRIKTQAEPEWNPFEGGWEEGGTEITESGTEETEVSGEDIAAYLRQQGVELNEDEMQDLLDNHLIPRRVAEEVDFGDEFKDFVEEKHERDEASKLYGTDLSKKKQ